MKEVRIYHTPWGGRAWWAFLIMLVFFGLFVWMFTVNPSARGDERLWIGLIGTGVMGLFFPAVALWERLSRRPAVVVMTDRVVCHAFWKKHEYRFDEVKGFELHEMNMGTAKQRFVNVHFLKQEEERRMKDASKTGRAVRRFNIGLVGAQESIGAEALTMKPQALCDLLNERLKDVKS